MVRVRVGSSWKQDPVLRAALARGGAVAQQAAMDAVDAVAVEVDGIDVGAGQAEGPLVASVEALGESVLRLLAGSARAQVHFSEGGVELVLGRRGASALITVVALSRPARVLVRDVEVDLADLARATREAASALEMDLRALQPPARSVSHSLAELVARLDEARTAPVTLAPSPEGALAHRPRRRPDAPACTFEIHDDEGLIASYRGPGADLGSLLPPGRVLVRAADGRDVAALDGPPFLLLRDLVNFAGRLADAVRRGESRAAVALAAPGRHATVRLVADLEAGTLAQDGAGAHPCQPLLVARAFCDAAVDFCGAVTARNPWQDRNGWIAELRTEATERRAHVQELIAGDVVAPHGRTVRHRRRRPLPRAPLGPGRMRRVAFRRSWAADVGAPAGLALASSGELLVAAGSSAVVGLDPLSGAERWRRPGATFASLGEGPLFAVDLARVAAIDAATGRDRWSVPLDALPHGAIRGVTRMAGGLALVVTPAAVAGVDPTAGRVMWTFAPPAAIEVRATTLGPMAVVGSDAGFLYGVDAATGATAWRLRLPGPLAVAPAGYGDTCFALCTTDLGGSFLSVDPATGRRRFEVPLDVTPYGPSVPFAGLLGIAGAVAGDPVVSAVDPAGRLAWEDAPPLGAGAIALAALSSGLVAKTADGSCVALDRQGEALWSRAPSGAHPPPASAAPVVARGIVLVSSEQVEALDAATGKLLGHAPLAAPVQLIADPSLNLWGIDADGLVTAFRLETHLSVL